MGQAAGTAAAIAVQQNISLHKINYATLQRNLLKQGVVLPGIEIIS
jgi:hypothetical protein